MVNIKSLIPLVLLFVLLLATIPTADASETLFDDITNFFSNLVYKNLTENNDFKQEVFDKCFEQNDKVKEIKCVSNEISKVYNYQRNLSNTRNIQQIVNDGGDCEDYTRLYNEILFKDVDIQRKKINMIGDLEQNTGHTFLIAYGKGYYCILDQKIADCTKLESYQDEY